MYTMMQGQMFHRNVFFTFRDFLPNNKIHQYIFKEEPLVFTYLDVNCKEIP